jgi:hypothetical protein
MVPVTVERIKETYKNGKGVSAFFDVAEICHKWLTDGWSLQMTTDGYELRNFGNKDIRPIFERRFIADDFDKAKDRFKLICRSDAPSPEEREYFASAIYTIQQTIAGYLDVVAEAQTSRKVAGEFFQGLVVTLFQEFYYETSGGNVSFNIDGGNEKVKLSFDIIAKPKGVTSNLLEPPSVVCGVKTTTKDRMNMFFVDRFLYEETHKHRPTFIALCLNDVQRKRSKGKTTGISYTFLPGHFRLYEHVFGSLDGFYYVVPPPFVEKQTNTGGALKSIDVLFFDELPVWLKAPS